MMTIVSRVSLKQGKEPEWDAAMRERLEAAQQRPGWVGGQLLIPLDAINKRMIVGTWQTRADWEAWHNDEAFQSTRKRLADAEMDDGEQWWHEVILDQRGPAA